MAPSGPGRNLQADVSLAAGKCKSKNRMSRGEYPVVNFMEWKHKKALRRRYGLQIRFADKIISGAGCSAQLGTLAADTGAKRVMCIYDKGVDAAGLVGPIVAGLEAAGIEVVRL